MSPKNILINLNDVENIEVFLQTTCALAIRHNAHLIGVYVVPSFQLSMGLYGSDAVMVDLQYAELKKYKKIAAKMVGKFEAALKANGVLGKSRIVYSGNAEIADEFVNQARTADLVVIPQVLADVNSDVEKDFAEKVVMSSGRPILIIPRGKRFEHIGDQVSIGWNLSSESARAAFDALPLISSSGEVRFVWVDAHQNSAEAGNLPGAEIAEAFSHYDLNVASESVESGDGNIGKALIHDAGINGSDLLVIGAYGHSRLRQLIFGGATRYLFEHLSLPVLMSH